MRTLAALLLAALAFAQTRPSTGSKTAFDKPAFETYLRYVELFQGPVEIKIDDPKPSRYLPGFSEVTVHYNFEGGTREKLYYVSADGQNVIQGDVFNINRTPFQFNLDKLNLQDQPSFGPENAPVTIVEFGDLQCPSCKAEAPVLRGDIPREYPDKVRVVFKDYPLESIHPWARAASIAARCVYRQNKQAFWNFYDWDYENQDGITPENLQSKVMDWAAANKLDSVQLGRCIESKASEADVNKNIADGRALGVTGTPSLFINGRKIGGIPWPVMQQVIDIELNHANAGKK